MHRTLCTSLGATVRWLQESWGEEEEKRRMGDECLFILPGTCVLSQMKNMRAFLKWTLALALQTTVQAYLGN